jgi:hypothetical protein
VYDRLAAVHRRFGGGIAKVTRDKAVPRMVRDGSQIREVSGVRQFVIVND